MNKTIKILACAAILGSAILTGCEKNSLNSRKGEVIRFSAVSEGAPSTKTAYGNDVDNYQMINWSVNDTIRIWSDNALHRYGDNQHWADYYTTGSTADGHKSTATLAAEQLFNTDNDNPNNSANGLVWGDETTCQFWGIYPSKKDGRITIDADGAVTATLPSTFTLSTSGTKTDNSISYKVCAPDMNYAFMTAYNKVENAPAKVNLEFNPAFTAFEIYLSSSEDETDGGFSVNSLTLTATGSSDYLSGPFTITAGNLSTATAAEGAQKSVSVTFNSAVAITPTTGIDVTFFTMPITNTGAIVLQVATTEGTATLRFTKKNSSNAYEFEAGQKYRIHLLKLGGRWRIVFGGDDMDVEPWEQSSTGLIVE